MNRIILLFLLLFSVTSVFAQKDKEHWIAPMRDRVGQNGQQVLYISTDVATPFPVEIYSNNVLLGTVNVSKGNPQTYTILQADRDKIITSQVTDCFTPVGKGLYIKGTEKFFVSLRFSITSHAEIITSKGRAGLGKTFYSVHAPITTSSTIYNFTCGILATEDNTTVTVSGYDPGVVFANGTTGASNPTMTFTLNKGKSYIIEGVGNLSGNFSGFIGAKIVADKPVCVSNGNFNGQFAITGSFDGSDIVMDQSVPTERLGQEFVMVKGNGDIGEGMEGAVVVATENDTKIYINNSGTLPPVATLNAGQFYRINDNVWNNAGNGHYNMYIRTSKNAYVYQLLAGVANSNATIGFNYIPPLNCFLPKKIDEIGKINEMPGITPDVKLNILTQTGAVVQVDGVPLPAINGPYTVPGTTEWVSYSVPNVTGNKTISSTKAVTAGVIGGASVYGYGGYFAGFSSIPVILKLSGNCIPGIALEVEAGFDSYQWMLNGAPIAGATNNTFTPTTPGTYTCVVSVVGCTPVTTPPYDVFTCPKLTVKTSDVCGFATFTPAFSVSTQPIDLTSVTIVTQPAHGTVSVDPVTGVITYTANAGYFGPDTFQYSFHSTIPKFYESEIVTMNLNITLLTASKDDTLYGCPYNGVALYDLTTAVVTTSPPPYTQQYYTSLSDAQNGVNMITNPKVYSSAAGIVYVKIITPAGCVAYGKVNLLFDPIPAVYDATLSSCYQQSAPQFGVFDLSTANVTAVTPVTKKYYPTLKDAENNTNEITNFNGHLSTTGTVYVRVINSSDCYAIAKIKLNVIHPPQSQVLKDKIICVEDKTTLDAGPGYTDYKWSTGATTQSISNVGVGEYWVQLTKDGCTILQTVKVLKSANPVITNVEIVNNTATLTVQGGYPPYKYSIDGIKWQGSNVFNNLPRGENTFYVIDKMDCQPVMITVTVPNLINAITPNNDNINDYIDYSALSYKENLDVRLYDRYGNLIFTGDKKNNFRWDGRSSEKRVYTGTYWYHITWTESDEDKTQVKYSGWVLVKNRE